MKALLFLSIKLRSQLLFYLKMLVWELNEIVWENIWGEQDAFQLYNVFLKCHLQGHQYLFLMTKNEVVLSTEIHGMGINETVITIICSLIEWYMLNLQCQFSVKQWTWYRKYHQSHKTHKPKKLPVGSASLMLFKELLTVKAVSLEHKSL